MVNGTIVPGVRIGKCYIGEQKSKILRLFSDNGQVWDRGDGFCICTYDNVKLWFDTDGTLCQIGVSGGFADTYQTIGIGSTMQDVCFELEDAENWDELTAPIEWIYVFKN